ncbi:MAG: transcription antitermination factor NusB [Catonella sp.]|uniref:transcription antitermination factor NusB n=1 Tax=Catonella sp. TaxID=2382125 RepID=UPI003F9EBC0F
MTRREFREHTAILTFIYEFYPENEWEEQFDFYSDYAGISMADRESLKLRVLAIENKKREIDDFIDKASRKWRISRIAKTDLMLLRVAVYEIKFDEEVPDKVAVNEAIELAKIYGGDESPAFVNGVLAKFMTKEEKKEEN